MQRTQAAGIPVAGDIGTEVKALAQFVGRTKKANE